MSRGVNKVILVGNLGQKPEMRYTATQTAVANLSIATSESWKDKNSGDLITTKLTWVVGSAIRGANANNALEAAKLLTKMGVIEEVAKAAVDYCPGLGEDLVWAFYLERHGWLTATPVARTKG